MRQRLLRSRPLPQFFHETGGRAHGLPGIQEMKGGGESACSPCPACAAGARPDRFFQCA